MHPAFAKTASQVKHPTYGSLAPRVSHKVRVAQSSNCLGALPLSQLWETPRSSRDEMQISYLSKRTFKCAIEYWFHKRGPNNILKLKKNTLYSFNNSKVYGSCTVYSFKGLATWLCMISDEDRLNLHNPDFNSVAVNEYEINLNMPLLTTHIYNMRLHHRKAFTTHFRNCLPILKLENT